MLHVNLNDLKDPSETEIASNILRGQSRLRVTIVIPDQYRAGSMQELASNWLKTWYMAESLAEQASEWSVNFVEGENGSSEIELRFLVKNVEHMAARLVDLAAVVDENDLEAGAFIYDEAEVWLESPGRITRFPELEKCYHDDAS
jgi:hypothetical protein